MRYPEMYIYVIATMILLFVGFIFSSEPKKDVIDLAQVILLAMTVLFAMLSSKSAGISAEAAEETLKSQQDAFERLERPYLFIENTSQIGDANGKSLGYTITNHGKLPAQVIGIKHYAANKEQITEPIPYKPYGKSFTVGVQYTEEVPPFVVDYDRKLAKNDIKLFIIIEYTGPSGDKLYEDTFKIVEFASRHAKEMHINRISQG